MEIKIWLTLRSRKNNIRKKKMVLRKLKILSKLHFLDGKSNPNTESKKLTKKNLKTRDRNNKLMQGKEKVAYTLLMNKRNPRILSY